MVDILKKKPKTLKTLSKINDMDPRIVEHYGNSYLKVIKKYDRLQKEYATGAAGARVILTGISEI